MRVILNLIGGTESHMFHSLIATVDCVKDLLKIKGFYDCKYVICFLLIDFILVN